jgi:nitrogen-specific signal transduction histidine kinase
VTLLKVNAGFGLALDLRNPLAAIKGIAQILSRQLTRTGDVDPAKLLDRVNAIDVATNTMVAQLDELPAQEAA